MSDDKPQRLPAIGGWFAIGIFRNKHLANHGSLWRSAWHLGAAFLFTVEDRLGEELGNADTSQAWQKLPSFRFRDFASLRAASANGAAFVAVEMGGEPLETFKHPERAVYLLGAEDQGLPPSVVAACTHHVQLPTVREASLNVAACGAMVMYDRELKHRLSASSCGLDLTNLFKRVQADSNLQAPSAGGRPKGRSNRGKHLAALSLEQTSGTADLMNWETKKKRALSKVSQHLSSRSAAEGNPWQLELQDFRALLDASPDFFVSLALPPSVVAVWECDGEEVREALLNHRPMSTNPAETAEVSALAMSNEELPSLLRSLLVERLSVVSAANTVGGSNIAAVIRLLNSRTLELKNPPRPHEAAVPCTGTRVCKKKHSKHGRTYYVHQQPS